MKYTTLPHSDVRVSKICLGTMTWGNQNTQAEGFEQMDYSLEKGVNFFDENCEKVLYQWQTQTITNSQKVSMMNL